MKVAAKKLSGVWACKIGVTDQESLPNGADLPMRTAVAKAFEQLTGRWPDFIFSGWNAELTEAQKECIHESPPRRLRNV